VSQLVKGLRIDPDTWQARIMPDTHTTPGSISLDAPRVRITQAAVDRAMRRLGARTIDGLAKRLGFSRQTFWRLRRGDYDIRWSEIQTTAHAIGWPARRVFEAVPTDRMTDAAA
jgi:hypothetical protein